MSLLAWVCLAPLSTSLVRYLKPEYKIYDDLRVYAACTIFFLKMFSFACIVYNTSVKFVFVFSVKCSSLIIKIRVFQIKLY